jgi:archaellum component FlaC
MSKQNVTLNNTLEEELRIIVCEQKKQIVELETLVKLLQHNIKDLEEQKYNAYKRLAEKTTTLIA